VLVSQSTNSDWLNLLQFSTALFMLMNVMEEVMFHRAMTVSAGAILFWCALPKYWRARVRIVLWDDANSIKLEHYNAGT
jgi:hypothetical protein